ncbi:VOC family protein [Maribacter confluentis]|uniref:Bleomycin resistance protein n=2 Tax=Maribacter confluentis TaxID=1656093 RepID=A0ABT8RR90_9FLAO|nr:VOC family protein [Maribacter confluentis]MDO1512912.1 VOC family protein [Maribacter confluentis]
MLITVHPKLPMRNKTMTKSYYIKSLGFEEIGTQEYPDYLMLKKDAAELHFFLFKDLNPKDNYGQIYIRTNAIDEIYRLLLERRVSIHPNGKLGIRPWGQKEFSLLDPDNNLLTFGQRNI